MYQHQRINLCLLNDSNSCRGSPSVFFASGCLSTCFSDCMLSFSLLNAFQRVCLPSAIDFLCTISPAIVLWTTFAMEDDAMDLSSQNLSLSLSIFAHGSLFRLSHPLSGTPLTTIIKKSSPFTRSLHS